MTETKIGIFSETDRLRSVAVFGRPGVEALLAQVYPSNISLFQDQMDVIKARNEVNNFIYTLRDQGVTVHTTKDFLIKSDPPKSHQRNAVLSALSERAKRAKKRYNITVPHFNDTLAQLVDEEIESYGQDAALDFVVKTCLTPNLPLANLMYARDPMNVLGETRVISRMARDIRQPEIKLYELFYQAGLGLVDFQRIVRPDSFEGGDAYIHDQAVWIGTGSRTTVNAAHQIFQAISPQFPDHNFLIVEDIRWEERDHSEQQDNMHLDTFSMPVDKKRIVVCEEEGLRRVVQPTQKNFIRTLEDRGQEVLVIPREEQQSFGCNFLVLDENTILIPRSDNTFTNTLLEQAGKKLIKIDLSECTKGYGAAHCMTGQLLRAN